MNRIHSTTPATTLAIKQTADQMRKIRVAFTLFATATLITACAGQPPKETMSQAELAVDEVTNTNAVQLEPLLVRKARDHFDQAKVAQQGKEYKQAHMLAEKAIVEARLAKARADAQQTQTTLAELEKSIKALRDQSQRSQQ